jgi:hypothetical protein
VSVFKLDGYTALRPLAQVQAKLQPALPQRRAMPALAAAGGWEAS